MFQNVFLVMISFLTQSISIIGKLTNELCFLYREHLNHLGNDKKLKWRNRKIHTQSFFPSSLDNCIIGRTETNFKCRKQRNEKMEQVPWENTILFNVTF